VKILHVTPYFPPDRVGGVGEVVAHLHAALSKEGHSSRVLTTGSRREEKDVVRVARSPERFILSSACWHHLAYDADILHVHHGEAIALLLTARISRTPTPILLTLHAQANKLRGSMQSFVLGDERIPGEADGAWGNLRLRVRHYLDQAAMALADEVSFISRSAAHDFLPPEQAATSPVIYNGLPKTHTSRQIQPAPTELLYVGTFSGRKRIHALPFVLAYVRKLVPTARLRIIGFHVDDHPDLVYHCRHLGVADAIVSEGGMLSTDLAPYYRASRVLLLPSAYEGLPMVVMEALQQGLPCVVTRVGGLPEIIRDGQNGFLVDVDDPAEMAAAAVRILKDPDLAHQMGAHGKAVIESKFSVERQVREYLALYRQVISRQEVQPRGGKGL